MNETSKEIYDMVVYENEINSTEEVIIAKIELLIYKKVVVPQNRKITNSIFDAVEYIIDKGI